MKKFTFRTEASCDNKRVPALLAAMDHKVTSSIEINDPLVKDYKMSAFSFYSVLNTEELKSQMEHLVQNDIRFADMHRCHQTLAEGDEPNEKWHETNVKLEDVISENSRIKRTYIKHSNDGPSI